MPQTTALLVGEAVAKTASEIDPPRRFTQAIALDARTQTDPPIALHWQPHGRLDVSIEVAVEGGGKPVIVGKTNLPDGFQAIASLEEGERILGQAKIEVRSGQFTA